MAADENRPREETGDAPLIDSAGAAVKRLIAKGRERGYITYDELNAALPSERVSSEQIEDTMATISELGINLVESEESDDTPERPAGGGPRRPPPPTPAIRTSDAPTTRFACICAKWGRWNCCRARARSPSPSASRPAAR